MSSVSGDIPEFIKFFSAGIAGVCGTLVCYPLDLLKLNMQVSGELGAKREQTTTIEFARSIVKRDGITGLYTGLSASILRQFLYTGSRLGAFQILIDRYSEDGKPPSTPIKAACSCVAGALGAIVGLPPDVALTRMAVDKRLPLEHRRSYSHVFNAMSRIAKEEGPAALTRGMGPTIVRAMVINLSQLISYIQAKEFLINRKIMEDGNLCYLLCSIFSSCVATACVLPPDMAKTRMQNMKVINGVPEYKHMLDVWIKCIRAEGPLALWKGFTPLLFRNGPQYMVMFFVYENLIVGYKNHFMTKGK